MLNKNVPSRVLGILGGLLCGLFLLSCFHLFCKQGRRARRSTSLGTASYLDAQARYSRVAPLVAEFDEQETDEDEEDEDLVDDAEYEADTRKQPRVKAATKKASTKRRAHKLPETAAHGASSAGLEAIADADPRRMLAELARGRLVD
jgi:hypothetical protein